VAVGHSCRSTPVREEFGSGKLIVEQAPRKRGSFRLAIISVRPQYSSSLGNVPAIKFDTLFPPQLSVPAAIDYVDYSKPTFFSADDMCERIAVCCMGNAPKKSSRESDGSRSRTSSAHFIASS